MTDDNEPQPDHEAAKTAGADDENQARLSALLDELVATGERAEMKSRIANLLDSVDQAVQDSGLPQELALAVLASDVYARLDGYDPASEEEAKPDRED